MAVLDVNPIAVLLHPTDFWEFPKGNFFSPFETPKQQNRFGIFHEIWQHWASWYQVVRYHRLPDRISDQRYQ